MPVQKNLLGSGFAPLQAQQFGQGDQGLTAAGTTSADATLISSHLNAFSTVAASTGAVLSTSYGVGDIAEVYNGGANTLTIYPPAGGTIDNTTSQTIVTLKSITCKCVAANKWVTVKST